MLVRLLLIITLFLPWMPRPLVAQSMPAIVFNELMWMGSAVSSADEWIELRNTTDQPVDISGWRLTKKSGGQEVTMLTVPAGSVISSGGYWLISNYAPGTQSSLSAVPQLVDTDVALSNSALQIKLFAADGTLIDTADDGTGNPLAGALSTANQIWASMERNPAGFDGTLQDAWHTATQSLGLVAGSVERGTPAAANSNGLPVAAAGPDQTATVSEPVNFDGSESRDPEQAPLTFSWDFGDGSGSTEVAPVHAYTAAGEFIVTLTVSDGLAQATDSTLITVTAAPFPVLAEPAHETAPTTSCRGVILLAVVPNPVGSDELESVTVQNTAGTDLSLTGCRLVVGSSGWVWPVGAVIAAGKTVEMTYRQSRVRLPNAGGLIRLIDVDGKLLDSTTYPAAAEAARWHRTTRGWNWEPSAKKGVIKKSTQSITKKTAAKEFETVSNLVDVQQYSSGDLVIVSGTVTTGLDVLGVKQITIEDAGAGCTLILPDGAAKVTVGDKVEARGTIRVSSGRRRIAVETNGLKMIGPQARPPRVMQVIDLGSDDTERLVTLNGTVATVTGNRFELDDGSEIIPVVLKPSTGIVRPRMTAGDKVTATGVVAAGTTGLRLYPRTIDDIQLSRVLGAVADKTTSITTVVPSSPSIRWWYWAAAGAGLLAINGRWLARIWRQRFTQAVAGSRE